MPRPRHKPSASQRQRVKALATQRLSLQAIARAVGINHKTLLTHYSGLLINRREARLGIVRKAFVANRVGVPERNLTAKKLLRIVKKLGKARRQKNLKQELFTRLNRTGEDTGGLGDQLMKIKAQIRGLDARRSALAAQLRKPLD